MLYLCYTLKPKDSGAPKGSFTVPPDPAHTCLSAYQGVLSGIIPPCSQPKKGKGKLFFAPEQGTG